jgi:hypothetical protein
VRHLSLTTINGDHVEHDEPKSVLVVLEYSAVLHRIAIGVHREKGSFGLLGYRFFPTKKADVFTVLLIVVLVHCTSTSARFKWTAEVVVDHCDANFIGRMCPPASDRPTN